MMSPSWMKGFGLILLLATVGVVSCQALFASPRPGSGTSSHLSRAPVLEQQR